MGGTCSVRLDLIDVLIRIAFGTAIFVEIVIIGMCHVEIRQRRHFISFHRSHNFRCHEYQQFGLRFLRFFAVEQSTADKRDVAK